MAPAKVLASRNTVAEVGHNAVNRPGPAHLMRAVQRFGQRLGNQFGAAITYFLVLAVMPIAMVSLASIGFVLDVARPELLPEVTEQIEAFTAGNESLTKTLEGYLLDWQAVGIIGILTGLYTGQGFIGNLGAAVRAQLHDDFDDAVPEKSFVAKVLGNVVTLIGLIIGLLLAVALTVVGTGLRSMIADLLGLSGFAASLLFIVPVILTFGAAWMIFWFLFTMLPERPVDKQAKNRGSLIGATAFLILINFSTVLVNLFSGNKAAGVFGSIIAIMLTLNVFARIILFIAAWIGTAKPPRPREEEPEYRFVEPKVQAQSLGALITGAGIVALTLLGFKRFEERRSDRE